MNNAPQAGGYAPPVGMPPVGGVPAGMPAAPVGMPQANYAAPVDQAAYAPPAGGYAAPVGMPGAPVGMPQNNYAPAGAAPVGMPQAGGYAPQAGGNQQSRSQKINKHVGKVTHTGNQLFEITGAVDITEKFPDGIGFVMLVPSVQDNTKKSGRSYVMNDKIVIKFSTEELHSLSEALKEAGRWGRCSFTKFSDPKKADSSSTADTKKFSVTALVEGENIKVFMSLTWGQKKISMPLTKYQALGLANMIGDLANAINQMKFEIDRTLVTQQ